MKTTRMQQTTEFGSCYVNGTLPAAAQLYQVLTLYQITCNHLSQLNYNIQRSQDTLKVETDQLVNEILTSLCWGINLNSQEISVSQTGVRSL